MLSTLVFILISSLFLIADLSVHGFYGAPRGFLVATFFYVLIGSKTPLWRLIVLAMGILYESFLVTGSIGGELVFIIPLSLLLSYIRQRVHLFPAMDALLVVLCVGITSARLFNPLYLPGAALAWLILLHFLSALSMVYSLKR